MSFSFTQRAFPEFPEAVANLLTSSLYTEFATMTPKGVPLDTPLFAFVGPDGDTIDVATGLAYPAKANRVRRNPKVGLPLEGNGNPGEPVVSVAGFGAVRGPMSSGRSIRRRRSYGCSLRYARAPAAAPVVVSTPPARTRPKMSTNVALPVGLPSISASTQTSIRPERTHSGCALRRSTSAAKSSLMAICAATARACAGLCGGWATDLCQAAACRGQSSIGSPSRSSVAMAGTGLARSSTKSIRPLSFT
jgi:hypothetical protein